MNNHPEADLQREIVRALRFTLPFGSIVHACNHEVRGSTAWHRNQQALAVSMGAHRGFSDLIVMAGGRLLFLEVKTPQGRASTHQMQFAAAVESQGHAYDLVRSVDDTLAALRAADFPTRIRKV